MVAGNRDFRSINYFVVGDIILRCLHGYNVGGIKLMESIGTKSEFNFLVISKFTTIAS